ncbi:MAG: hypothetical protein NTU44_11095 [Bacteroidetes bacterium]|nr:hypothetical protein [Bacteroidota bacterium]
MLTFTRLVSIVLLLGLLTIDLMGQVPNPAVAVNISGTVKYENAAQTGLDQVNVFLKQGATVIDQTLTNHDGGFTFQQVSPGSYTLSFQTTKPSGGINSTDALIAFRHFMGLSPLTGIKFLAGDVNGTGYINVTDALLIHSRFLGLISTFTVGDWCIPSVNLQIADSQPAPLLIKALCYGDLDGNFIPPVAFQCGDNLTDTRDGKQYATVQIGTQCWMKQNLNVGTLINGNQSQTNNAVIQKYCYNNLQSNCSAYGGLYQWNEMMQYDTNAGGQGICPIGWHIPTDAQWTTLTDYLGGSDLAGGKLKETGTTHWDSPNTGASNESGFSALGSGYRTLGGNFLGSKIITYLWTSHEATVENAFSCYIDYENGSIIQYETGKTYGFSVRCLKNCPNTSTSDAGPDQFDLPDTITILAANPPAIGETGTWTIISGMGGTIADSSSSTSTFTGQYSQSYTLIWTISNACGSSSSDTVFISFIESPFICGSILTDIRDGQIYSTIQIGTQCWMKKNLNIGTMVIGSNSETNNGIIEKYCYDNNQANCTIYGGLYDWNEMMQYTNNSQGICPNGWHIPSDMEWCTLINLLDPTVDCSFGWDYTNAGGKMKETGITHWNSPNTGASNSSGFTALGSGCRNPSNNMFYDLNNISYFWTSTGSYEGSLLYGLGNYSESITSYGAGSLNGYSVRCMKIACNQLPSQSDAGQDQTVIGTTTTLAANTPQHGTGTWSIISGAGGVFTQPNNPSTEFNGNIGTSYTLVWSITTSCAGSLDSVVIRLTSDGFYCGSELVDSRDGKVYNTVQIGNQCWLKENLNIGTMVTSTVTGSSHSNCSNNGVIEKYCFNNDTAYCAIYGGLYDWNEMMQYTNTPSGQGICPPGWHLPSFTEWKTLGEIFGGLEITGGKMKETGLVHWNSPNEGATNESGFTALGTGNRFYTGAMGNLKNYNHYWSSSKSYVDDAWELELCYNSLGINAGNFHLQNEGSSVRCLKNDCSQPPTQSNAGPDQTNTGTTTLLAANTPQYGLGSWSIESGNGGHFYLPDSPTSIFSGLAGGNYTLRWTITNNCISNFDEVVISFTCPATTISLAGPDQLSIPGITIMLAANHPAATETGTWIIAEGTGGTLADSNNPTSLFTGQPSHSYLLVWRITNSCANYSNDTINVSFTAPIGQPCLGLPTYSYGGQTYNTVQIGSQCWMKENLNIGTTINGSANQTNNDTIEKYCYNNDPAKCAEFGGLYQWNEMMKYINTPGNQGICPNGWHIPTDAEWCSLMTYLEPTIDCNIYGNSGNLVGGKLKETGLIHWISPNNGATNETSFYALGGGYRSQDGYFYNMKFNAIFWSSSIYNIDNALDRGLSYNSPKISRGKGSQFYGFSVRCINDSSFQ